MPGSVDYWFKEGKLPAHTKEEFNLKYNILTVNGTIVMNALVFCSNFDGISAITVLSFR